MSKLVRPARKCFVSHLDKITKCDDFEEMPTWLSENGSLFQLIWIQGVLVQDFQDSFILEDPTGRCEVLRSDTLASRVETSLNGYVMVIGEIVKNGSQPIVKGIKIQDLSNEEILKAMWPLEVKDLEHTFH